MARTRAHVTVAGMVQGVGYRWSTRRQAAALGLVGWVRNLPDGSVEALFEGDEAVVQSMIRWCAGGPAGAVVRDINTEWLTPTGKLSRFEITF